MSNKLSHNEKAATFIGWKPTDRCCAGRNANCNHDFWHSRELSNPAPDMTDPRNYMRALEEVLKKPTASSRPTGVRFTTPSRDKNAHETGYAWRCLLSHGFKDYIGEATTIGAAAALALAALYDHEGK